MPQKPLAAVIRRLQNLVGTPAASLSDRQLLHQYAREHNEGAFGTLVRRYGALVMGVCGRILPNHVDAEDVFQATFLVLARKAGSLSWRDSVGNWLYGVAYRLALKARGEIVRRQQREQRAAGGCSGRSSSEADLRELAAVLDDEMQRLPEHCRSVLVACYLEGLTRDETARRLGWSLQTLDRRLKRGRDLLRARLLRRGITLSAALLTTSISQGSLSAAVSPRLAAEVVRAALVYATSPGAAPVVSAKAIALADALLRNITLSRASFAIVALLGASLAAGVGTLVYGSLFRSAPLPQPSATSAPRSKAAAPQAQTLADKHGDRLPHGAVTRLGTSRFRQEDEVRGLAYAPDGKMLASAGDARIHLLCPILQAAGKSSA